VTATCCGIGRSKYAAHIHSSAVVSHEIAEA
jgi:hypothetical protein